MLTRLGASQVPVTYLRRSSIAMWGAAPVVWNASGLLALAASRRASAVFVARNCASRNGREKLVRALDAALPGGVDRPGGCLNNVPWPRCGGKRCGKHAVLRRYPFYLAFENSNEADYVTEKARRARHPTPGAPAKVTGVAHGVRVAQVFHALEAGVLPIYLGAPNVAEYLPDRSALLRTDYASTAALADAMVRLVRDSTEYRNYFEWKRRALAASFDARWGALVLTHAKCRLCRWAYAHRHGFRWDSQAQAPDLSTRLPGTNSVSDSDANHRRHV